MAVAVAVASGLADCGLGVRSAANALALDFIPIEKEEYDLVFRHDFYVSSMGQALCAAMASKEFRDAVMRLGGYDLSQSGTLKLGLDAGAKTSRRSPAVAGRAKRSVARRRQRQKARR